MLRSLRRRPSGDCAPPWCWPLPGGHAAHPLAQHINLPRQIVTEAVLITLVRSEDPSLRRINRQGRSFTPDG
jgi:hypothetical protein